MNILIIRTSAMGDIIHCLPVLTALRRSHPQAKIAWVVERAFAPLLAGHPDIDELITVKLREWRKNLLSPSVLNEIADARRALRRFAPDIALELMGNHKGGMLAWVSGARRIVGAARAFRRERSSAIWIRESVAAPDPHTVDRSLTILKGLGLNQAGGPVDGARVDGAPVDFGGDKILTEVPAAAAAFLEGRPSFVTIQAGAGWANKTYPAAWWGDVAHAIKERTGIHTWVPIAPGEEELAQSVVAASSGAARAVDAAPFPFLAALLRASCLVLGGDTGPIHLAHALGTPVLCLIGPTDPQRNGPYGAPERVIWKRLPCSCCYKRYDEPKACLLNITPADVAARALELLATSPKTIAQNAR